MERRLKLLFGIVASIVLIYLNTIPSNHIPLIGIFQFILPLASIIGIISAICLSLILIIDAFKTIRKSQE